MNLNAKRQGAMPLSLQNTQQNTISDLNGLIENRQLVGLNIRGEKISAIIYRSNLSEISFYDICFSNLTHGHALLPHICSVENLEGDARVGFN